ncbi:FUSC family protein [Microbacterium sp. X-17]|uniref:FUSC family protein n=1 Tax=Microbacterium sp. X-17 TaxID=3144404 RepID=UPI0031F4F23D
MSAPRDPATGPVPTGWRRAIDPRAALGRVRDSWPAILQIVVAATAAYAFAFFVIGHPNPILAVTIPISSLGLAGDARPLRVLETVVGMLLGVFIAELLLVVAGTGWWQVALAMTITLLIARALSAQPGFAIVAAIQSAIVVVLPTIAPFARFEDAVVGAVVALLATALLPRRIRHDELRKAKALFAAFDSAAGAVGQGLRRGDRFRAERGLEKARALSPLVEEWRIALDSAVAVARISPFLRRGRAELIRHERVRRAMDLAVRNLRVLARRAVYQTDDGVSRPVVASLLGEIVAAAGLINEALDDIAFEPAAREALLALAGGLDPRKILPDGSLGDQDLAYALRPIVVDLLTATGLSSADARAAVPRI